MVNGKGNKGGGGQVSKETVVLRHWESIAGNLVLH